VRLANERARREHAPDVDLEEVVAALAAESLEFAAALEEDDPKFQVAREILKGRREESISQAELARRMRTAQSVVSRLERMEGSPNLRTVFVAAKALGRKIDLRFVSPELPGAESKVAKALSVMSNEQADALALLLAHAMGEVGAAVRMQLDQIRQALSRYRTSPPRVSSGHQLARRR
jgi:transcriptional regulator with XRE-family HTH domain